MRKIYNTWLPSSSSTKDRRSLVVNDGRLAAYPTTDAWPKLLKEGLYLAKAEAKTTDVLEPNS